MEWTSGAEDNGYSGAVAAGADAEKGNKIQVIWLLSSLKGSVQLPKAPNISQH